MSATHTRARAHVHVTEQLTAETYPHVHGGPVVLDIGGDIGALLATMDPSAVGTELHLRSEHEPPISIHTGVWRRTCADGRANGPGNGPGNGSANGEVTTAVFAELPQGTYWALDPDGQALVSVDIRGGEVAGIDLRGLHGPRG